MHGTSALVFRQLPSAGLKLVRCLEQAHLSMASKSFHLLEHQRRQAVAAVFFKGHQIDIQVKLVSADLGIDRGRVGASIQTEAVSASTGHGQAFR
eukprot:9101016-Pyramimonas_sp.AAC.1